MYLKVYNQVLSLGLSPNELKVYLYLSHCANALGAATVRTRTIQEQCAISSAVTVRAALGAIETKGLVRRTRRFDSQGQSISNKYQLSTLQGRWFALKLDHSPFQLSKAAFAVYLYLCSKADRVGRAFPSLTLISSILTLSRQTVVTAIRNLVEYGFIRKAERWAGKHNLYFLQSPAETVAAWIQKKNTAATLCSPKDCSNNHIYTMSVPLCVMNIKSFNPFFRRSGSLKIDPQYKYPSSYNRIRKLNSLYIAKLKRLVGKPCIKIQANIQANFLKASAVVRRSANALAKKIMELHRKSTPVHKEAKENKKRKKQQSPGARGTPRNQSDDSRPGRVSTD